MSCPTTAAESVKPCLRTASNLIQSLIFLLQLQWTILRSLSKSNLFSHLPSLACDHLHAIFECTVTSAVNAAVSVHPTGAQGPSNHMQSDPPPLVEITSLFSPPTPAAPTTAPPPPQPVGLIRVQVRVQGPSSVGTYMRISVLYLRIGGGNVQTCRRTISNLLHLMHF
jgi:hypothetical protein